MTITLGAAKWTIQATASGLALSTTHNESHLIKFDNWRSFHMLSYHAFVYVTCPQFDAISQHSDELQHSPHAVTCILKRKSKSKRQPKADELHRVDAICIC